MKLEDAINKAMSVLHNAGYPTMFVTLENASELRPGEWELTYKWLASGLRIIITFDASGNLVGVKTRNVP